jgi:hypothetical protein
MILLFPHAVEASDDLPKAIRRAQYLFTGTVPTENEISRSVSSRDAYKKEIDSLLKHPNFYSMVLRYHERVYGVGLEQDYLEELQLDNIDDHAQKIATINCEVKPNRDGLSRFKCSWASDSRGDKAGGCAASAELPVRAFWYRGVTAWVCPAMLTTCGSDLRSCLIRFNDQNAAANVELGSTEIFDSRIAIVKSLSKQASGIAASLVVSDYPYTYVLQPGLTAVDGAIAHLFRQSHHFDMNKLGVHKDILDIVNRATMRHTRFQLVNMGPSYEQAGALTTFGWLRRYEKNRSRANHVYQRFLCRKFTASLPRVFPQDPGNLRETPGCEGQM